MTSNCLIHLSIYFSLEGEEILFLNNLSLMQTTKKIRLTMGDEPRTPQDWSGETQTSKSPEKN